MREDYSAIAIIIDRSGSMVNVVDDTIGGVNTLIKKQQETEGDASILMVQFDNHIETIHDFVPVADVGELTTEVYGPRGGTALLDCIGTTCNDLGKRLADMDEADRPGKVMVAILTDGMENASREFTPAQIKEMIKHQEEVYNWDFNFLSADLGALQEARNWGFSEGKSAMYAKSCTAGTFEALSSKFDRVRNSTMDMYMEGSVQDFEEDELLAMVEDTPEDND
jgi:uncharacterized protein YegL